MTAIKNKNDRGFISCSLLLKFVNVHIIIGQIIGPAAGRSAGPVPTYTHDHWCRHRSKPGSDIVDLPLSGTDHHSRLPPCDLSWLYVLPERLAGFEAKQSRRQTSSQKSYDKSDEKWKCGWGEM